MEEWFIIHQPVNDEPFFMYGEAATTLVIRKNFAEAALQLWITNCKNLLQ
jgi:hypothetical protein